MGDLWEKILDLDNLTQAWEETQKNKGMPGVDDISIERWQRNWEERIINLISEVRSGRYKPSRMRIRRIPKRKPGEWRVLRIPTVTDRVLMRAVLQVLHEIYEPIFLDCSFGYRPGRSLKDAVQRVLDLRNQDYLWILDADIDACFDSLDHELLLRLLEKDVADQKVINLIAAWLEAGAVKKRASRGVPMGSPISPILTNVYLHPLDATLMQRGRKLIRYADDFIVLEKTEENARESYDEVYQLLLELNLKYEPSKTRISSFEQGFTYLGVHFLKSTYSYCYLEKQVEVTGDQVDILFSDYMPDYDEV